MSAIPLAVKRRIIEADVRIRELEEQLAAREAQSVRDAALHALERAKQFIENGVEFGYIRMPTVDDDPANYTLPTIEAAIRDLKSAPPQKPVSDEVKP